MFIEMEHKLNLKGIGETKERAFNDIFSKVKKSIANEFPDNVVLQIEPENVDILSAVKTTYTEKFFGLFFPRKRHRYEFSALLTVRLRMIELSKIEIKEKEEKTSLIQHVLQMK